MSIFATFMIPRFPRGPIAYLIQWVAIDGRGRPLPPSHSHPPNVRVGGGTCTHSSASQAAATTGCTLHDQPYPPILHALCTMAIYNTTRFFQALLAEHESSPPSFTVRLYPDYWQLNNGSKWLYNNQIAVCAARTISLLWDLRDRTL